MMKASLVSKELALLMRSRVVSAKRTNNFETFTVEVELPTRELVTATVAYDHEGKGLAASFDRDDITAEMIAAVRIAALDGAKRLIEEREAGTGKLVKEREGWNWKFADEAGLHLSGTGHLTVPPEEIVAHRIGHVCLVKGDTAPVTVARLEYVGKAFFGEPRVARGLATGTKWTGDYLKFAVYAYRVYEHSAGEDAVIVRQDGSGTKVYLVDQTDSADAFRALCAALPEPVVWDILSALVHSYHQGRTDEGARWQRLFLDGRLKRKRRSGRASVEILPEKPPVT